MRGKSIYHLDQVRADFDQIALLPKDAANNNSRYHRLILAKLPKKGSVVLDVGCGTGELARALAAPFERVVAIDLSERMIQKASLASEGPPNCTYCQSDLRSWDAEDHSYDAIVSVAALHHLPLADSLPLLARWLRPGGSLIIVDLMRAEGLIDFAFAGLAVILNYVERSWKGSWQSEREKKLWVEHGERDQYLNYRDARREYRRFLPGAKVRRLLFHRYIVTWCKPS